jgi:hypothetical protein
MTKGRLLNIPFLLTNKEPKNFTKIFWEKNLDNKRNEMLSINWTVGQTTRPILLSNAYPKSETGSIAV